MLKILIEDVINYLIHYKRFNDFVIRIVTLYLKLIHKINIEDKYLFLINRNNKYKVILGIVKYIRVFYDFKVNIEIVVYHAKNKENKNYKAYFDLEKIIEIKKAQNLLKRHTILYINDIPDNMDYYD